MHLGFYYHIPIHSDTKGLSMPGYLGVFLDSLAKETEKLTLFMHEANSHEASQCDYLLKAENIRYTSLGLKTPAWDRFLWPAKTLKKIKDQVANCDTLLVRAPSPLAPAFYNEFHQLTKVVYLVVGDYVDGAKHLIQPWWRKIPITILSKRNDRQLRASLKFSLTLVNSTALFNKYKMLAPNIFEVKTTTLTANDFFERSDTCLENEIRILYTGGLYLAKGLLELLQASAEIMYQYKNVTLHFVGGEYEQGKPVETSLKIIAANLGVEQRVFFHGYKTTGPNLNEMYKMADIYAIPSYHEGFPRTIWEAMANSLPVIATKVGSIPYFLEDRKNALLIEPKNVTQLIEALITIITNQELRQKMISSGFLLAKENILELQTKLMVDIITSHSFSDKKHKFHLLPNE